MTDLFGLPLTLPRSTASAIEAYLRGLWVACYSSGAADLDQDLEACGRYFNPVLRGQTLRTRIAEVQPFPPPPEALNPQITTAVIIRVDARRRLMGVEGRLVLEALTTATHRETVEIDEATAETFTRLALQTYRRWSSQRLDQVIALQTGQGKEYLQPKAVGIVLALLLNRATTPERAVPSAGEAEQPAGAEAALFDAAEAFATRLGSRNSRSSRENRLRGGYAITEARRRIPYLSIVPLPHGNSGYFLATADAHNIIDTLGHELARRTALDPRTLTAAFDDAVAAFRSRARVDSWQGGFHERAAETDRLRRSLLRSFESARTTSAAGA